MRSARLAVGTFPEHGVTTASLDDSVYWKQFFRFDIPSEVHPNTTLFRQDATVRELFLIEKGFVKLSYVHDNGDDAILSIRHPGQWADHTFMPGAKYQVSAVAMTRCELHRVDARRFAHALSGSHEAGLKFMTEQARRIQELTDEVAAQKTLDARHRLARILRGIRTTMARAQRADTFLRRLPLQDQELASMIGISKQHFSALKAKLIAEGALIADNGANIPYVRP